MKILIFSDSHGHAHEMSATVQRERPDEVFYLGDGLEDLELLRVENPDLPITEVAGNCDSLGAGPWERVIQRQGRTFFLTHGHLYSVKSGMGGLLSEGIRRGADAVLFGHTHQPLCERKSGIWLVNPGSIGQCRTPGYGIILLEQGELTCHLTKSIR